MKIIILLLLLVSINKLCLCQTNNGSQHDISGVMTTVFTLVNVPLSIINIQKLATHNMQIKSSLGGIVTGVFQSAYGAYQINDAYTNQTFGTNPNKIRTLGRVNLGVGLTSIIIGGLNIAFKQYSNKKGSAQVYTIHDKWVIAFTYKSSL